MAKSDLDRMLAKIRRANPAKPPNARVALFHKLLEEERALEESLTRKGEKFWKSPAWRELNSRRVRAEINAESLAAGEVEDEEKCAEELLSGLCPACRRVEKAKSGNF